jgi:tetratricopeptide (TPR) repeat protein
MNECPYKGLAPYDIQDDKLFVGRGNEIKSVISSVYGSSLTILYGESGVGKTSLIRAGLLPMLKKDEHRVAVVLFRDWQKPDFESYLREAILNSLLSSINRIKETSGDSTIDLNELREVFRKGLGLESINEIDALPLDRLIKECSGAFHGRLIFIFDQFEEYIYYHPLNLDGKFFDPVFARAINDHDQSASFLLSLREDGLGKLDRLRSRIPGLLGNLIKIEHLDADGAEQAIDTPLKRFSEDKPYTVVAETQLKQALLEQVDADRLELDEADEQQVTDFQRGDSGIRYKALALQAVLTQLWEVDVARVLKGKTSTGTIELKLKTLEKLATNKKEHETEVQFVVRTYFDKKLNELSQEEVECAAETLRGLVRAGGHKRARTAQTLAKETTLSQDRVTSLLEKLSIEPFNILRKLETATNTPAHNRPLPSTFYELNHDVMAFAIVDWSNRQRQTVELRRQQREFDAAEKLRVEQLRVQRLELEKAERLAAEKEKQRQQEVEAAQRLAAEEAKERQQEIEAAELRAKNLEQEKKSQALELKSAKFQRLVAWISVALILIGVALIATYHRLQENARKRLSYTLDDRAQKLLQFANYNFAIQNIPPGVFPDPRIGMLAAIDAVASCRMTDAFLSPRYAYPLLFGNALMRNSSKPVNPVDVAKMVHAQIPAVMSPDGKYIVMKSESGLTLIRIQDGISHHLKGEKVLAMGFDRDLNKFGIEQKDGPTIIWDLKFLTESDYPSKKLSELGIAELKEFPDCFKSAPANKPWEISYDRIINNELKEAIGGIIQKYPDTLEARARIGVPARAPSGELANVFTDEVQGAYDSLQNGKTDDAKRELREALGKIDSVPAITLTAFERLKNAFESVKSGVRWVLVKLRIFKDEPTAADKMLASNLLDRAATEDNEDKRKEYISRAIKLDRTIGGEDENFQKATHRLSIAWSGRGDAFAEQGKHNEALEAYRKAIMLDPSLAQSLEPENKAQEIENRSKARQLKAAGDFLASINEIDESKAEYRKAVELDASLNIDPENEWKRLRPSESAPNQ